MSPPLIPLDHQVDHWKRLSERVDNWGVCIDGSKTGLGKTPSLLKVAVDRNLNVIVVCPVSAIGVWEHECNKYDVNLLACITYDSLAGSREHLPSSIYIDRSDNKDGSYRYKASKLFKKAVAKGVMLIADEVHSIKNNDVYRFQAVRALSAEIHERREEGCKSCMGCASATYIDHSDQAVGVLMICGFITDNEVAFMDRKGNLDMSPMERTVNTCLEINKRRTRKIIKKVDPTTVAEARQLCDRLLSEVLYPELMSSMEVPESLLALKNAKNLYVPITDEKNRDRVARSITRLNKKGVRGTLKSSVYTTEQRKIESACLDYVEMMMLAVFKQFPKFRFIIGIHYNKVNSDWIKYMVKKYEDTYDPHVITGEVGDVQRTEIVNKFQKHNSSIRVLIVNVGSGGMSKDMQDLYGDEARVVVIFECPHQQKLTQMEGRVNRCLQASMCYIRYFRPEVGVKHLKMREWINSKSDKSKEYMTADNREKIKLPGDDYPEITTAEDVDFEWGDLTPPRPRTWGKGGKKRGKKELSSSSSLSEGSERHSAKRKSKGKKSNGKIQKYETSSDESSTSESSEDNRRSSKKVSESSEDRPRKKGSGKKSKVGTSSDMDSS